MSNPTCGPYQGVLRNKNASQYISDNGEIEQVFCRSSKVKFSHFEDVGLPAVYILSKAKKKLNNEGHIDIDLDGDYVFEIELP